MVQQTVDSKFNEYGLGSPEANLPTHDKQQPVSVKKIALRELQNENRIMVPNSIKDSPYSKDRGPAIDANKVSGIKRPAQECPVSPSKDQSPNSNAANGHLVYVRRKFEAEVGKTSTSDSMSVSPDCTHRRLVVHQDNTQQRPQIKEPMASCVPVSTPLPVSSPLNSSEKPSVPPLRKTGIKSPPAESNYHHPVPSAASPLDNPKRMKNPNWEERYHLLMTMLKKLDQSDQDDYIQTLRSLSSVELSRHAVELEKRSIQLSLEEAKEVARVAMLNVLGKSIKTPILKAPSTLLDNSNK